MRTIKNLNLDWKYTEHNTSGFEQVDFDDSKWESVYLPHINKEIPFNYFDDQINCFISNYRKKINVKKDNDKVYTLTFEGIANAAKLFVNGVFVSEHKCAYTDFATDITNYLVDGDNVIAVLVDSTERPDVPPFGGVVDYLCYGGIYRDCYLVEAPTNHIVDVYAKSNDVMNKKDLDVEVLLSNNDEEITVSIIKDDVVIAKDSRLSKGCKTKLSFEKLNIDFWSIKTPILYDVIVETKEDKLSIKYGFRKSIFTEDGFFLNGERLQLMGLNRHQSFPYVGYAMPKNAQREDADILKNELGVNIVRSSHYPPSKHFLNRCDEIGLLVFEEIPGWNHIGDEEWKQQSINNLKDMILRDRNHPSVVLWGVRINESDDNHELYLKTNAIAHSLDYRQTAGVRWKPHSEFLEDVFTINDFVPVYEEPPLRMPRVETGLDHDVPYLVTEYMGHMFPTKINDNESRLVRHAERHAQIQNFARSVKNISGAIGWCAFDYNTHRHFGTNDKICYHGVMDMFRNSKYAANAYLSQSDPQDRIVFEPATIWGFGEKDIGGVLPLFIYTNVDKVTMFFEGRDPIDYYPSKDRFPFLPHPPVVITEMPETWGSFWKDVSFVGYIDGKEVARKTFSANPLVSKINLELKTRDIELYDSIRIKVSVVDEKNNVLKFYNEPLQIEIKGGRLVGPSLITLSGGMYSIWVIAESKDISVTVSNNRLEKQTLEIKL